MILFVYHVKIWDSDISGWVVKTKEISLNDNVISCTTNQTEKDFSLSLELSEFVDFIKMGGIIRADVDGVPYDFRIKSISYTESTGTMSITAKYRGFDLNGIYPKIIRGDLDMKTPNGAVEALNSWTWYGGYEDIDRQKAESNQYNRYVDSVVKCTDDNLRFPFYLSTMKSVADIAYNDIAGAIGYICRPCDLKDFEIVRPSKEIQYEFVYGVNIADITAETTETDKPAGVVSFYKNPNNGRFALGDTYWRSVSGRYTLYDAGGECTPEEVPANPDVEYLVLYRAAEARQRKINPTYQSFDNVYTITPTPDVKGIKIFDHVAIYSPHNPANPFYASQQSTDEYDYYKVSDISIKSLSYDCVNKVYTSITVGDRKSDYIDLMISESEESDRLDSVQYASVVIRPEDWTPTYHRGQYVGLYTIYLSNASLLKFFEISNYTDEIDRYVGDTEDVRISSVSEDSGTKEIKIVTDYFPAAIEPQVMGKRTLTLKMWRRGQ